MSTAAQNTGTAALGVVMFLVLSIATNLAARVRDPSDVGLAFAGLLTALTVGAVSVVVLRRAPRPSRLAFAGAVTACIAVGLVAGGPLDVVPGPWPLVVPDVFINGAWSMPSWLLLGASGTWAVVRRSEPVAVEE